MRVVPKPCAACGQKQILGTIDAVIAVGNHVSAADARRVLVKARGFTAPKGSIVYVSGDEVETLIASGWLEPMEL